MEACENNNVLSDQSVEDAVREPLDECSPSIAMDNWTKARGICQYVEDLNDCPQEFLAESLLLRLVPEVCLIEVCSCSRSEK